MKRLISLSACLTLLVGAAAAQTSDARADETVLRVHSLFWGERRASYMPCEDCGGLPQLAVNYRYRRLGRYDAWATLENPTRKTVASVRLDYVFFDAADGREFLRYHVQFDRRIGPGRRKDFRHEVGKGREVAGFSPAAPGAELLRRAAACDYAPDFRPGAPYTRTGPSCVYVPEVTRIDYADGSFWRPRG